MSIPVRNNLDLGLNQLLAALVENVTADPTASAAMEGRVIYRTDTNTFKVCDGSAWQAFLLSTTRLDQIASPTAPVALNAQKITGLADGTAATDAVTKQQLDNVAAGLDIKPSARVATTANITLSGTQTIDGIAVTSGDRVLVRSQTAPAENGVYIVAAGAWSRATDMDAWTEVPGALVAVEEGTANADTVWLATADQGGTIGTTAVTWSKIAPAAGGGSGTVVKFAADITGNASATSFAVTHNLGSTDVQVQVWEATTNAWVIVDVVRTNANTVTVTFAVAPANAKVYRVVVMA